MNTQLQVFQNDDFGSVRTAMIDNEPWFVGRDVAQALEYVKPYNAISKHVDDEDKKVLMPQNGVLEKIPPKGITIINESGLYSLILSSKLPTAKRFKRWVTSEVLPAIRRSGVYSLGKPSRELTTDDYMEAARLIVKCQHSKLKLVCDLLKSGGFEIPKVQEYITAGNQVITIPRSVADWLEGKSAEDVIGHPTAEIYDAYGEWCEDENIKGVPHISFSKYVNCTFGTSIKQMRVDGKNCKVFI